MEKTFRKIRWFWGWEDDKQEAWLRKMSQSGTHLIGFDFPFVYKFKQGIPKNFIYHLDFFLPGKTEKNSYLPLFTNAGWEYIGEIANWQYFRIETNPGEETEIQTENASKIQKHRRMVFFLLVVSPLLYYASFQLLNKNMTGIWGAIKMLDLLVLTFFVYAILKTLARINQLSKQ